MKNKPAKKDHIITTSVGFRPKVLDKVKSSKLVTKLGMSVSKAVNVMCEQYKED